MRVLFESSVRSVCNGNGVVPILRRVRAGDETPLRGGPWG
jgi:hypothetical protein